MRPTQGRYIAGVCAALGRATNTDPVLWRVVLVVLALFGGVGVLIYLLGWLGIRAENDAASPVESLFGRGKSSTAPLSVALLLVAAVLTFLFVLHDGMRATLLIAAIGAGIFVLLKRNTPFPFGSSGPRPFPFGGHPAPAAAPTSGASPTAGASSTAATSFSAPTAPPADQTARFAPPADQTARFSPPPADQSTARFTPPPAADYRPPFAPHGPYAAPMQPPAPPQPLPPRPPKPPRERSKLGRITFFAVLMVLGILAAIDVAGATIPLAGYFAAALATVALGLLAGAWFGRARGLIALAVILTLGLSVTSLVDSFGSHLVNNDYRPATVDQVAARYDFTAGNVTLDLSKVDFTGTAKETTITMKVGQVKVVLPPNVDTDAVVAVQNGRAVVFGSEYDGDAARDITVPTNQGADGLGGGTLKLDLRVEAGNVEVDR